MSEHTDAARLEALRDSMRPRVEVEAVAEIVAMEWDGLRPDEVMRNLALDLLDARAEVERWREEVARAATALDLVCGSAGCESFGECEHANMLRAALALPTNAPEAKE